MTEQKVSIELTQEELTCIRVAVLRRMTTIKETAAKPDLTEEHKRHLEEAYQRCFALMDYPAGKLYLAMRAMGSAIK